MFSDIQYKLVCSSKNDKRINEKDVVNCWRLPVNIRQMGADDCLRHRVLFFIGSIWLMSSVIDCYLLIDWRHSSILFLPQSISSHSNYQPTCQLDAPAFHCILKFCFHSISFYHSSFENSSIKTILYETSIIFFLLNWFWKILKSI